MQAGIFEAKSEDGNIVACNGKPIVKMTPVNEVPVSKRIGIAKGKFNVVGDFDTDNKEITEMLSEFGG